MSNSITEWYKDYTITTFEGVLCVDDIIEVNNRWMVDPRFDKISYYLADFRKVPKINFEVKDYKLTAVYFNNLTKWGRKCMRYVGLILPPGEIEKQVERYLKEMDKLNNPWPRKTFKNLEDGHTWARDMMGQA